MTVVISDEAVYAALRASELFVDVHDKLAPVDCWGDLNAASGPCFACLAVAASLRGWSHGPRTLLWASSESGDRAAAFLYTGATR